jgi:hypothetical protein
MVRRAVFGIAVCSMLACSSSSSAPATSNSGADAAAGDAGLINVAPLVVDDGPSGTQALNVAYTTITICRPGTTTCQTIDHIEVDTGSVGLRILSSVLDPTLALPQQMTSTGDAMIECYAYADGFNWGPVVTGDLTIGGELAKALPLQIAGGAASTPVPSGCSSAGSEEDSIMGLGANGIIGVGVESVDCGAACAATTLPRDGAYYGCSGTTCTKASVPPASQVQNPVSLFAHDNNGVVIQLPAVAAGGVASVSGSLIFGIGTASNNALGSAQILTLNGSGNFTSTLDGQSLTASFIDSGSLAYSFPDASITQCTGNQTSFYCPASPLSLTATNTGQNQVSITTPFNVANATALYDSKNAACDGLAITSFTPGYFDWGLPFFYGRTVFTAMSGASTPGGVGPYFAY